ncbi:multiheme c-type cytochrome [Thalassotalea sp. ND16A]|uniref:multiheme c-type cytochrome n=1 Tax=Thalassotalea sp. ND16A TaxID=1535422 RepID=UPI00068FC474|nr:multiheme c-type cytochrome [Thalassotalea sp. ND16A]
MIRILLLSLLFSLASLVEAASLVLPQFDKNVHLGVASCAASMCHGSLIQREGSDVLQNEYIIWSNSDTHAQAYQSLLTATAVKIADNLGIADAGQADICLDCHSDNVKQELQGDKFQLSDGIGCEACHGGGQHYISSHTDGTINRKQHLQNGLFPTDQPQSRAQLCLSCHLGNNDKYAGHDIMGAGHPRLAFELDTFGVLQPLHYVVDDDYKAQKWSGDHYITWVYGQLQASRAMLTLIINKLSKDNSLFPELALFDCHSCHHSMDKLSWTRSKGQGFKPGTVRLNDGNFKMLIAIASGTKMVKPLQQHLTAIGNAVHDKQQLTGAIAKARLDIDHLQSLIEHQPMAQRQRHARHVLQTILEMGSDGAFADYIAAEQTTMAIDLLFEVIEKKAEFSTEISELFDLVYNENNYQAIAFREKISEINNRLN